MKIFKIALIILSLGLIIFHDITLAKTKPGTTEEKDFITEVFGKNVKLIQKENPFNYWEIKDNSGKTKGIVLSRWIHFKTKTRTPVECQGSRGRRAINGKHRTTDRTNA